MTVHLFARSSYTLLESTIRIGALASKAKSLGYQAIALTDRNVLYGAAAFSRACREQGIKPIFGMEIIVNYHEAPVPFVLLAKDNLGFKNLMSLSSMINDKKEGCQMDEFIHFSDHCFIIAYGEGGFMDTELIDGDPDHISEKLKLMKSELPYFYIAVSFQESSLWRLKNALLKKICHSLDIPTVALNKIYYLEKNDADSYQILTGIRLQKSIYDHTLTKTEGRYLLSMEEMDSLYETDDLRRTDEIAAECKADIRLPMTSLPRYTVPSPLNAEQYLTQLCLAGLDRRPLCDDKSIYLKRLHYELTVITKMHFEDYFLIVWDFIRYAKKQGIHVGPGRGSAAGSLVSFCLGITEIDPLRYNLLFERFLNPERISMPDIDTDIPDDRRQEVIEYVHNKYGDQHVANIITFGTLGARQVIRDVGKVMNISSSDLDMLTNMIPTTAKISLNEAVTQNRRLAQIIHAETRFQKLFNMALKVEGLPRHVSTHAAGVILSSLPLDQVIPTVRLDPNILTSQYSMEYLEERGLIKMDLLGLRNLTIIDKVIQKIKQTDPDFKLTAIPLDDQETLRVFTTADTVGIFQFESDGMINLLKKMRPNRFSDVVATLALFRPASMASIPVYLRNRADQENILYPDVSLIPVLKETYGVMLYQEQTMQTAEIAAGFSLAKADVLRKAISKKKGKDLAAMRDDFVHGCLKNGYTDEKARSLFDLIERFGGYGFNKSHAVAYTMVAYQMAYLKAHEPMLFYCSLLDNVIGDADKTMQYIDECRKKKINILYPSINKSEIGYVAEKDGIRLPLSTVRGVGSHNSDIILAERSKGEYLDFFDFVARVSAAHITRKMIESLINGGALDCFNLGRTTMISSLDDAIRYSELTRIDNNGVITINLGLVSKPVIIRRHDAAANIAEAEKDALGFSLGPHPIENIRIKLNIREPALIVLKNRIGPVDGFAMIQNVHPHRTKKGTMMAFLKLTDETGEQEMAVMPNLYAELEPKLTKGTFIRFHGKMQQGGSLLADRIQAIPKLESEENR